MAKKGGNPQNLKPFKPGQSGNPSGKPKGLLTTTEVSGLLSKFCRLSRDELTAVIQNNKSSMIEITVASILAKAAKDGDYSRLEFLLARSIGKVKEQLEVSTPKPYVIERLDGTQVLLGSQTEGEANERISDDD